MCPQKQPCNNRCLKNWLLIYWYNVKYSENTQNALEVKLFFKQQDFRLPAGLSTVRPTSTGCMGLVFGTTKATIIQNTDLLF